MMKSVLKRRGEEKCNGDPMQESCPPWSAEAISVRYIHFEEVCDRRQLGSAFEVVQSAKPKWFKYSNGSDA